MMDNKRLPDNVIDWTSNQVEVWFHRFLPPEISNVKEIGFSGLEGKMLLLLKEDVLMVSLMQKLPTY